jgi:primase-polymerase (primpol)-like protein
MNPSIKLPTRLTEGECFVCWKLEPAKDGKDAKIPYDVKTGRRAKTSDSETWAGFDACHRAYRLGKYTGIGIVLTGGDGLVCIDLDHCLDEKGKPTTEALTIITKFSTYIEVSPSGSGLHVWLEGEKPGDSCKKGIVEIYESGRYITLTGKPLFKDSTVHRKVNEQQKELEALYWSLWPKEEEKEEKPIAESEFTPLHSLPTTRSSSGPRKPRTVRSSQDCGKASGRQITRTKSKVEQIKP